MLSLGGYLWARTLLRPPLGRLSGRAATPTPPIRRRVQTGREAVEHAVEPEREGPLDPVGSMGAGGAGEGTGSVGGAVGEAVHAAERGEQERPGPDDAEGGQSAEHHRPGRAEELTGDT